MDPDSADRFLVEEIRRGSESAWRQLIERFNGRLLAFAQSRTASLVDAEDLVQETFLGFIQSLPGYDLNRSLETYLFTILRYKIVDRLRGKKTAPIVVEADDNAAWDRILPSDGETPSRAAAAAELSQKQAELLAEVLRRLIREYRDRGTFEDLQVIELLLFAGLRNLEVAELLSLDQKAVAGVKFRALGRLRVFLDEMGAAAQFPEQDAEVTVAKIWRDRRLTCLKRGTLGAYLLGALDEPWLGYTQFHLDVVNCTMCLANLRDLAEEERSDGPTPASEQIFASSVGFLSRPG
jgi:RNA polymerase sigma-70 factor (ECF subfamily)